MHMVAKSRSISSKNINYETHIYLHEEQLALEMCWSQPVSSRGQNLASKTKQPFYRGTPDGSAVLYCKNSFCITGYLLRQ